MVHEIAKKPLSGRASRAVGSKKPLPISGQRWAHIDQEASAAEPQPFMKAVEIQGEVDDQHRLHADVPRSLSAGAVRVIVLISEEDEGGPAWAAGVSSEWSAELNDPAQDIYTLNDGQTINALR
jgi:hypothetical protein